MKPKFLSSICVICVICAICGSLFLSGCSTLNNTPVIRDLVPDVTDPEELRDAAELAGALVLANNPNYIDDVQEAVLIAQRAIDGGSVITRAQFDGWIDGLLTKTVDDPVLRIFVRQRFARAWDRNSNLLDAGGLILKKAEHRALAQAFISGLKSAADSLAQAGATARINAGA